MGGGGGEVAPRWTNHRIGGNVYAVSEFRATWLNRTHGVCLQLVGLNVSCYLRPVAVRVLFTFDNLPIICIFDDMTMSPFGCANKPAEKHYWLICCESKTLFRLKKQAEKYRL
jgi:hypothetical protein